MLLEPITIVIVFHRDHWLHQRYYLFLGLQVEHRAKVGEQVVISVCVKEPFPSGNIFLQNFNWAKILHLSRGIRMNIGNLETPVLIPLTFFYVDLQ